MCTIDWAMLLGYLKVFLSWPAVVFTLVTGFVIYYRKEIRELLPRISKIGPTAVEVREQQNVAGLSLEPKKVNLLPAPRPGSLASQLDAIAPNLRNDPTAKEDLEAIERDPVNTLNFLRELNFKYKCERIFYLIFGTQVQLLTFLELRTGAITTLNDFEPFHREHQKRLGAEKSIVDYVNFLSASSLIEAVGSMENHSYRLTIHGMAFLKYIRTDRPADWNKKEL